MGLRTKFLISLIIVTAGLTLASLLMVGHSVRLHVREELVRSLDNSAVTFVELQRRRESEAQRTAELIANVPALKAMMTTGDPATIQDASGDIWRMAGTNLLALSNSSGKLMAVHTAEAAAPQAEVQKLFARSLSPFRARDWWFLNGRLYEVFLQPILTGMAGEQNSLGVLAIGYEVDSKMAREVTRIAAGQVAFRFRDQVIVSTLSEAQTRDLEQKAQSGRSTRAQEMELGGETFLADWVPLASDPDSPVQVVMLKSYDQATLFLRSLNRLILSVAVFAVVLGTVFVFFISHTFTRPLAELLTGVRALEKGDFEYPLKPGGGDEVAHLTRSFDSMRRNLQESQGRMVNAARMEAVGQLAGGVAHDFNNLVTIIKGYTDLLLLQIKPGDAIAGYAEQIKKAGDRAASVTRQLLAFSRKQATQRELLDLNAVATGLSKMMRVLIGEDIEVKITSESGLRKVFADPGQVEQVLLNLTVNARDAMPRGGHLTIETTNAEVDAAHLPKEGFQAKPGHYVKLSVTDTGCGMSPEVQSKIFQPFFTTKETGKGTGLGLTIVYSVIKNCSGFVTVSSEVGRGTTFHVYLPEAEASARPDVERAAERVMSRGSGTILVVEDEDALRGLARESLKLRGYQVLEASNGVQALELFGRYGKNIDLTITDVVMPQMSGVELVERLRQSAPEMRVLFMSGYSDRVDEILKSNVPLLQKPFTPDQLAQAVGEMLGAGKPRPAGAGQ